MVTYFCAYCGQYLKKKQGVDHGYCSQDFCCVICKQEVKGAEAVKLHNCEVKQKKSAQRIEGHLIIENIGWKGFKNTLRKIIKK